jgi:hypothetical protein
MAVRSMVIVKLYQFLQHLKFLMLRNTEITLHIIYLLFIVLYCEMPPVSFLAFFSLARTKNSLKK